MLKKKIPIKYFLLENYRNTTKAMPFGNDGNYYFGKVNENNLPHGFGKLYYSNGIAGYIGYWNNGLKEGEGKGYDRSNTLVCKGDFKNDELQHGELYYKGKLSYKGDFKDGIICGVGEHYNLNGIVYKGEYRCNGIPHGLGTLYQDGKMNYHGYLKNGIPHGFGKAYGTSGELKYHGFYVFGLKHGPGVFYDLDNIDYKGLWDGGLPVHLTKYKIPSCVEKERIETKYYKWVKKYPCEDLPYTTLFGISDSMAVKMFKEIFEN